MDRITRSSTPLPPSEDVLSSSPPGLTSQATLPSSPPPIKPKKPPPVTPRSFKRFFTPRSLHSASSGGHHRSNRHALGDITTPALNRLGPVFARVSANSESSQMKYSPREARDVLCTPSKKRKLSFTCSSPPQSSPLRRVRIAPPIHNDIIPPREDIDDEVPEPEPTPNKPVMAPPKPPTMPLRRSNVLHNSGQLFLRSLSDSRSKRVTVRSSYSTETNWQDQVSNFYSRPEDIHQCSYNDQRGERLTLPFCTASCHTNSLVAIGDEEGCIRLVDAAKDVQGGFSKAYLCFQPHMNSIMDLEFSSDDRLLATASGDQTARIIDMPTQTSIYCLSKHSSSVKRVQFQPASNDNVVATCSRDGSVNIWDLRYKAFEKPAMQLRCSLASDGDDSARVESVKMKYPQVSNTILAAHAENPKTNPGEAQSYTQRNDMTITSIAFLHPGRENLFVTSCQSNACVRLWDLRTTYSLRRKTPVPLAITQQPESHQRHRQFGITSMSFGGDGGRLYTLCRDGTVYAYSTSHLILGSTPEMSSGTSSRRFPAEEAKPGLGPLYGFRHPRLQVSSFFVKLAVRKAMGDKTEMIAAGSSDNCAVVFPTDERLLSRTNNGVPSQAQQPKSPSSVARRPGLRRSTSSMTSISKRLGNTIPIYQQGAPLIKGHQKEVSGVSWTNTGKLVTVSDDLHARCWREGPDARDLRRGGDAEGRRWGCGWADVPDSYDDDDE